MRNMQLIVNLCKIALDIITGVYMIMCTLNAPAALFILCKLALHSRRCNTIVQMIYAWD